MDFKLLNNGLVSRKNKRRWVLVLGAFCTFFGAYKIYNAPSVVKKRERLFKFIGALLSVAEMVSDSSEVIGIVSKDLKSFIQSDSNQIPQSLKQISKITTSDEFSESLTRITRAMTLGISQSCGRKSTKNGCYTSQDSDLFERATDKLFSNAGVGFASVVVGSFAKNLVVGVYSEMRSDKRPEFDFNRNFGKLVEIVSDDKCRELIGEYIRVFVSTAVTIYLDKTKNINTYDQIFSALTNPKHELRVRDMMVHVSKNTVETLIGTSYRVLTAKSDSYDSYEKTDICARLNPTRLSFLDKNRDAGSVSKMINSTLMVPRNRRLVLDMTGVLASQSVKSFLEFVVEKPSECVKKGLDVVHQEVLDRGIETIGYVSGKSSVCLGICLHILNSPWIFTTLF